MDNLFEETDGLIHEISKDTEKYDALLEGLILQGAYALMEPEISIRCRQQDVDQVVAAADRVAEKYEANMKVKPVFVVSSEDYLPSSDAGGVIMTGLNGKITVDNTLGARLDIAKEEMLPQIRVALFGHSPSRTFFN